MAEAILCATKPKRAKKKKQLEINNQLSLDSIPEESPQDLELIYKTAAESVFQDIVAKVVDLLPPLDGSLPEISIQSSIDVDGHDNATVAVEDNIIPAAVVSAIGELALNKDEAEEEDDLNAKLNAIDSDLVLKSISAEELNSVEPEEETFSENPSLNITPLSLSQIASNEAFQPGQMLKPSVFVGKGKLYSSSLQIGCHWDRTKYNIVLLPDLSKVVYPDLDSLMSSKTSGIKTPFPAYGYHHPKIDHDTRNIDRSSKPAAIAATHRADNEMKMNNPLPVASNPQNQTVIPNPVAVADAVNKEDKPEMNSYYVVDAQNPKYIDFNTIDDVPFRIYDNPVLWRPGKRNRQSVLFRVGPLYYEERFTNCASADGLIMAVKERAEILTREQLVLAQACLLTDDSQCKAVSGKYSTVVIYGVPSKFDRREETFRIKFGVNEGFYEEDFEDCKTAQDLFDAVNERSDCIAILQGYLKSSADIKGEVTEKNLSNASSGSDCTVEEAMNFPFPEYQNYLKRKRQKRSARSKKVKADTSADQGQTTSGVRRTFKSVRNWFKDTFSKKSDKYNNSPEEILRLQGKCLRNISQTTMVSSKTQTDDPNN